MWVNAWVSRGSWYMCCFSVMVFSSSQSPALLLAIFLSAPGSHILKPAVNTRTSSRRRLLMPPNSSAHHVNLQESDVKTGSYEKGAPPFSVPDKVWMCGHDSTCVLSCVHSSESICPHQRSSDGMKWKSSVGQCENIHTHAGVELTQQGVRKWAAFMLTPEAAAVSLHLPDLLSSP